MDRGRRGWRCWSSSRSGAVVLYRWQMPRVRAQLVSILSEELGARVELADLRGAARARSAGGGPRPRAAPQDSRARAARRWCASSDFTIDVPVLAILRKPIHVNAVTLDRLEIFLPKRARPGPDAAKPPVRSRGVELHRALHGPSPVVIDALRSIDATLAIESSKPDRPPRTFEIHDLMLTDAAFDRPVRFNARLTNPKPTGQITRPRAVRSLGGRPAVHEPPSAARTTSRTPTSTPSRASTARWNRRATSPARSIRSTSRAPRRRRTSAWTSAARRCRCRRRLWRWSTAPTATRSCTTSTRRLAKHAHQGERRHPPYAGPQGPHRRAARDHRQGAAARRAAARARRHGAVHERAADAALAAQPAAGESRVVDRLELDGEFTIEQLRFASDAVQDKVDDFSRRGRGRPSRRHDSGRRLDDARRVPAQGRRAAVLGPPVRRSRCAGAVERLLCAARRRAGFPGIGAARGPGVADDDRVEVAGWPRPSTRCWPRMAPAPCCPSGSPAPRSSRSSAWR